MPNETTTERMGTREWLEYIDEGFTAPRAEKTVGMRSYAKYREVRRILDTSKTIAHDCYYFGALADRGASANAILRACRDFDAGTPMVPEPDWSR